MKLLPRGPKPTRLEKATLRHELRIARKRARKLERDILRAAPGISLGVFSNIGHDGKQIEVK